MPVHLPAIKNILLAAVTTVILTLAVNAGYGLVFLVWRDVSLPEALRQVRGGAPYLVLGNTVRIQDNSGDGRADLREPRLAASSPTAVRLSNMHRSQPITEGVGGSKSRLEGSRRMTRAIRADGSS
jgi:hypothetical protein